MKTIAIFPGSFDPITLGHVSVVNRAIPLFDKIIIGIGINAEKKSMFSADKRKKWIEEVFINEPTVSVETFSGLNVDFCRAKGARYILRGLRTAADFEFERGIGQVNKKLFPDIDTLFLLTEAEFTPISSSIVRESDAAILTRAGIEKGVASTKAFATQTMVLWMLSLYVGQEKQIISNETLKTEIDAMLKTPKALVVKEKLHSKLTRMSKRYLHGHGFFFIGRDIFYPLALEGALKLKEISYFHAEGYPAGEMKHGPIALADSELYTIALMPKSMHYDKIKSNVEELSARDATILAISPEPFELADDFIQTYYDSHPMLEFFEMMVITQLLALEISVRLGNDVDMPRNLAKSVTVE